MTIRSITRAIIDEFVETARKRGQSPIVSFLPSSRDFPTYLRTDKWIYADLHADCRSRGYDCFDAGTALVRELGAAQLQEVAAICRYFCPAQYLGGHYNGRGNEVLADVTVRYLAEHVTLIAPASAGPRP